MKSKILTFKRDKGIQSEQKPGMFSLHALLGIPLINYLTGSGCKK